MAEPANTARTARLRVWFSLLAAPVIMGFVFGAFGGTLALSSGLSGEALVEAIAAVAAYPTAIAFALILLLSLWLARKDGLGLNELGWRRPGLVDVAIGVGTGALVWTANAGLFYPLIRAAQPAFDPGLIALHPVLAAAALLIAIAAEESLYRGYALQVLGQRHGKAIALIVSALAYAFITPINLFPLPLWALGFGLLLALLRLWRRCLWPGAIAHMLVSLGPVLFRAWLP